MSIRHTLSTYIRDFVWSDAYYITSILEVPKYSLQAVVNMDMFATPLTTSGYSLSQVPLGQFESGKLHNKALVSMITINSLLLRGQIKCMSFSIFDGRVCMI